jgi:response regulator RpfG family c-di-GMP phosphodiesterase
MPLKYTHRLLVVDDEESITKALYRIFRREGYEIDTASSGQEGLALLKEAERPFSLIISDQRMPGMTGTQFLEKVKKILPDVIRILLTGYSDMDAIVDAINKGEIHRYLTKPWKDDDLLVQIRQALEQYELRAENRRLLALTARQNKKLRELGKNLKKKVDERTLEIKQKNKELQGINKKLEKSFLNAIRVLSSLIETLNPKLGEYMGQVAALAREIAEEYGLDQKELDQIEIAGMLHDIGLLGVAEGIFEKDEDEHGLLVWWQITSK